MACNDIRKYTSGEMHGMMTNHLNLELRGEKFHANKEIDNSKSDMNYYLKVSSGDELRTNFDKRILEVDEKHPPKRMKKDRKTGLSICCYVPKEISSMGDEAEKEFLEKTIGYYEKVFGKDNVIGMSVHKDEIHSYIDKSTKEMTESLVHGHLVVVPYAKWKDKSGEREGINASHCIDRQRLIDLNKDYNEFVKKEFGIDFNRGNGIHNGETVEEMKEASKELTRAYHQNKVYEKDAEKLQKQIERYQSACTQRENNFNYLCENVEELVKKCRIDALTASFSDRSLSTEVLASRKIDNVLKQYGMYKNVYGLEYGKKEPNPYYDRIKRIFDNENELQKLDQEARETINIRAQTLAEDRFNGEINELHNEIRDIKSQIESDEFKGIIYIPQGEIDEEMASQLELQFGIYEGNTNTIMNMIKTNYVDELHKREPSKEVLEERSNVFMDLFEQFKNAVRDFVDKIKNKKEVLHVYEKESISDALYENTMEELDIAREELNIKRNDCVAIGDSIKELINTREWINNEEKKFLSNDIDELVDSFKIPKKKISFDDFER